MRTFVLVLIILSLSTYLSLGTQTDARRYRRNLVEFAKMIAAATGRNPLDYNGYGCYCGVGGFGTPVDNLDRCCQTHDSCYTHLKRGRICQGLQVYFLSYKTSSPLKCDSRNSRCGKALCECDRDAALCFRARRYNNKYKNYSNLKCLFQG
ncbi:Phospholipase A2 [Paramuricea clavata]|uniref:Phospholipase A2 n=1 Tax=Paramuricea clavata TaxID=317549 RepID=A0A6S7H689_PARCT|nr:Phospholipase A2 [Paramuricea clavata]